MKRIRVVAAVIRQGDSVLIQQRGPAGARAHLWEFPGGKIEPGETPEAALVRECREEMDVGIEVRRHLADHCHAYADLEVELAFFECQIIEGVPKPLQAPRLEFRPLGTLAELEFCEADRPFLAALTSGVLG